MARSISESRLAIQVVALEMLTVENLYNILHLNSVKFFRVHLKVLIDK